MPPLRACTSTSAPAGDALRRVFLSPASGSTPLRRPAAFLVPALHAARQQQQRRGAKRRAGDDTETLLARAAAAGAPAPPQQHARGVLRWAHPDRDEGIGSAMVVLIDSDSGELSRPRPLQDVLRSIDRKEFFVVRVGGAAPTSAGAETAKQQMHQQQRQERQQQQQQQQQDQQVQQGQEVQQQRRPAPVEDARSGSDALTAAPPPERRRFAQAAPGQRSWPLCKILPRKEVFARDHEREKKLRKQALKAKRPDGKTVELGWTMADGDLAHRMRKAREILVDLGRVSLALDKKRRRDVIDPAAAQGLLDKALAAIKEVPGAKEARRDGKLGESMRLVFDKS